MRGVRQNDRRTFSYYFYTNFTKQIIILQLSICIAQVHHSKMQTHQQIRTTTSAGAVIQLMGSDDQWALPQFGVVLAYNRVNHYLPTVFLSHDSLLNWKIGQIDHLLSGANSFFMESAELLQENEPQLHFDLTAIFDKIQATKHKMQKRAKQGTNMATSVPVYLTGKKPTRGDQFARWRKFPAKDYPQFSALNQPKFKNPLNNPTIPQYLMQKIQQQIQEGLSESDTPAITCTPATPTTESTPISSTPANTCTPATPATQSTPLLATPANTCTPATPVTESTPVSSTPAITCTPATPSTESTPVLSTTVSATPVTTTVTTSVLSLPVSLNLSSVTTSASAHKGVGAPSSASSSSNIQGSQSAKPQRKGIKASVIETEQVDDDRDEDYDPDKDKDKPDEDDDNGNDIEGEDLVVIVEEDTQRLSQEVSLQKGIPQLPRKRKGVDPNKLKYKCCICARRFQRTSERRDHNYTEHLGLTYDCEVCLKSYMHKKGLKQHIDTHHNKVGRCKCPQEGCDWADKDSGKLHNHLLVAHEIGEPVQCCVTMESGEKCGKIFTNTRSFQQHAAFHLEKKFKCDICDHFFSKPEQVRYHIRKYHKDVQGEDQYQCEFCAKVFHNEALLDNHKKLHILQHHRELKRQKLDKDADSSQQSSSQSQPSDSQPSASQTATLPTHAQPGTSTFSGGTIIGIAKIDPATDLESFMEDD